MSSPQVVVRVSDVWKSFGATQALRGAKLELTANSIHGLVGRNGAGKSTLVAILSGIQQADAGSVEFLLAADRQSANGWSQCATVYQQSQLFPYLSVAENLFLQPDGPQLIRWREMNRRATDLLQGWDLDIRPDRPVHSLRNDERQLVEIARAFAADARIFILDEPTAALQGKRERDVLFQRIRQLRSEGGASFLFISHHLEEIFELCDVVTVLRDGSVVGSRPVAGLSEDLLVQMMVGRVERPLVREPETETGPGTERFEEIILRAVGQFPRHEVSQSSSDVVELRRGEALGLVGAAGSGAIATAEAIAGFQPVEHGWVEIGGKRIQSGRSDLAIRNGIAMVAADRHAEGLFPNLSVAKNISISAIRRVSNFVGLVSPSAERKMALSLINQLSIVASSTDQSVASLSGGNQQKAMFARALACTPRVLVLCNPTVGVDVASKAAIYEVIQQLLSAGVSLIIATEDELKDIEMCDRVIVFKEYLQVAELGADRSEEQVLALVEGLTG